MIERLVAVAITLFARFVTAVRGEWRGTLPDERPRVYFGNHRSHGDFVLVWTVLPGRLRRRTRPVAGADYWLKDGVRRFIGKAVFNSVLIERDPARRTEDPVTQMATALDGGASLILFPEGTRNLGAEPLLPFKTGLFHLGCLRPQVELVPVWIANLNRVMPKGELVPVPLLCSVTFGAPIQVGPGEDKETFLARASAALLDLAPRALPA